MLMACADCGCLVDQGLRVSACGMAGCCCSTLPTRQALDQITAQIVAAFADRDLEAFGRLLADDARWGDDEAPNKCGSRGEVVATFQRLLAEGVGGAVTGTTAGRAGILCHLRIDWPDSADSFRRHEVFHLYRVREGQIVAIEPYDNKLSGESALRSA